MTPKRSGILFLGLMLTGLWGPAFAAATADDLFLWNVTGPEAAAPGEVVAVTAEVVIAPKHHVYREYTTFDVHVAPGIKVGRAVYPAAKPYQDPIEDRMTEVYADSAAFLIPLWISPEVEAGTYPVTATITYQGCSDTVCYRKKLEMPPVTVAVAGTPTGGRQPPAGFEPAATEGEGPLPPLVTYGPKGRLERLLGESFLLALPLIFLAGILTSFTPCVYPLIPITVSIFGAREAKSRAAGFRLSLTYVLGIAVMYSALGLFAASTGAVFGSFMADPLVIGIVAAFFVAMGLSMLGVFSVQLPGGWINRAAQVRGRGHAAAFGMGLVSGVIASPCTGPILAGVLAYVATTGNLFLGFWLLFVYALGIGVLFVLIGTFSGLASSLPRAGGWMETVKAVFAVVLFGMALYFLRTVIPPLQALLGDSAWYYAAAFAMAVAAVYLGAFKGSLVQVPPEKRPGKAAGLALASAAVFLFAGSFTVVPEAAVAWKVNDVETNLRVARAMDRPALVDFYADWCAYCVKLDRETFSDPRVGGALERFVVIKADFTRPGSEEEDALRRKYEIQGLPVLLFFDSGGNLLEAKRVTGFMGPEELIAWVEDIR